jgi:serine/threonine protein kinase
MGNRLYNRYTIVNLLKRGGMGAVYLANDSHLGNQACVVKEMLEQFSDPAQRQVAERMFEGEANILSRLRHSHIPRVYDHFTENGRHYLVMDYVEGENLEEVLKREGRPIDEKRVVDWALQICDVLAYLHEQQPVIVFRDLKPANLMLQSDGQIRLIDFGIARHFAPNQSVTPFGTPMYTPLEQYQGRPEPRSDLYALGATMHHLLSGRESVPFQFPMLRTVVSNISPALEALVVDALNYHPGARPQSARHLQQALQNLGGIFAIDADFVHPILEKNGNPLAQFRIKIATKGATMMLPVQTHFCLLLDVSGSMGRYDNVGAQKYLPALQSAQHFASALPSNALLSILVFAKEHDLIFATELVEDYKTLKIGAEGGLIDSSRVTKSPGDETHLYGVLSKAIEITRQFQKPNSVHRIVLLTDGQIHDIESCGSLFETIRNSNIEIYAYGLGTDWQVEPLKTMLTSCRGGSFKPVATSPSVSTYDITNAFSRFVQTSQNIIATDASLEITFSPQVKPGDVFRYSPIARLLGSNVYNRNVFATGIEALESGQEYIWCFECRLQRANQNTEHIATATLRYNYQGSPRTQSLTILVERDADPRRFKLKDDEVEEVFTFLEMLRSADPHKQLLALMARLDIATRKGYDPEHLNALRNAITTLQTGGRIEDLPLKDQLWVRTDPRGSTVRNF